MHKIVSLFVLFFLFFPVVLAAEVATNPANDPALRLIISESLKTREEIKSYLDLKTTEVATQMQKYIDDDIVALANRLNDLLLKAAIKFGIIWFSTTFLSNIFTELIFRKVYARAHKSRKFQEEQSPVPKPTQTIHSRVQRDIYDPTVTSRPIPTDEGMRVGDVPNTTNHPLPLPPLPEPKASPDFLTKRRGAWPPSFLEKHWENNYRKKQEKMARKLQKQIPELMPLPPVPEPSYIEKTEERLQSAYERLMLGGN